jgi:hypothetical protein
MKIANSRHDESYREAKKEVSFLYSTLESNSQKLKEGFVGGGFFVTLSILFPEYKAVKLFVKGQNRTHVLHRLKEFPDAYYFIEENPDCSISVCGAGLQHPSRAEGLIHEQKKS